MFCWIACAGCKHTHMNVQLLDGNQMQWAQVIFRSTVKPQCHFIPTAAVQRHKSTSRRRGHCTTSPSLLISSCTRILWDENFAKVIKPLAGTWQCRQEQCFWQLAHMGNLWLPHWGVAAFSAALLWVSEPRTSAAVSLNCHSTAPVTVRPWRKRE